MGACGSQNVRSKLSFFLLMRAMDQRFNILSGVESLIDDPRSPRHTDRSLLQLLRQRVYQVAAGYEDCNDANHPRVDSALRLALGKEHESGAGQSSLSRFENKILATGNSNVLKSKFWGDLL